MTDHYTREDLKKLRAAANVIGTEWEAPVPNKDATRDLPELCRAVEG
jgi:hypothetical protein